MRDTDGTVSRSTWHWQGSVVQALSGTDGMVLWYSNGRYDEEYPALGSAPSQKRAHTDGGTHPRPIALRAATVVCYYLVLCTWCDSRLVHINTAVSISCATPLAMVCFLSCGTCAVALSTRAAVPGTDEGYAATRRAPASRCLDEVAYERERSSAELIDVLFFRADRRVVARCAMPERGRTSLTDGVIACVRTGGLRARSDAVSLRARKRRARRGNGRRSCRSLSKTPLRSARPSTSARACRSGTPSSSESRSRTYAPEHASSRDNTLKSIIQNATQNSRLWSTDWALQPLPRVANA
eukprot:2844992-Rhodomonas_salina.4